MLKKIAVPTMAVTIFLLAAPAVYATPVALGGTDTRGTSSGGHMSRGMHHMKMNHHTMMKMKKHSAM